MLGYSATDVFDKDTIEAWTCATGIVHHLVESKIDPRDRVRCHELARAVHRFLPAGWEVVDGKFGIVEHSWLVRSRRYVILDVYSVGRLPMVQLHAVSPKFELPYRDGPARQDVRDVIVERIAGAAEMAGFVRTRAA